MRFFTPRQRKVSARQGQVTTETLLMAPFFFLITFLALQMGHLGLSIAMVQYATASVARHAVQNDTTSLDQSKFADLLGVGLKDPKLLPGQTSDDSTVTKNLTVTGCAKLSAYPFVGEALKAAGWNKGSGECSPNGPLISLAGDNSFQFLIRAQSTVRMNYQR